MYRRLLVAVDGGDRAALAAEHAIGLAAETGAELECVYVVDVRPVYSRYGLAALPTEDEVEHQRQRGQAVVEDVEEQAAAAGVVASSSVVRGTPHLKITEHAAAVEADAIVIGGPRERTFTRMLGVSTTDRVVRNAGRTVIIVRQPENDG